MQISFCKKAPPNISPSKRAFEKQAPGLIFGILWYKHKDTNEMQNIYHSSRFNDNWKYFQEILK